MMNTLSNTKPSSKAADFISEALSMISNYTDDSDYELDFDCESDYESDYEESTKHVNDASEHESMARYCEEMKDYLQQLSRKRRLQQPKRRTDRHESKLDEDSLHLARKRISAKAANADEWTEQVFLSGEYEIEIPLNVQITSSPPLDTSSSSLPLLQSKEMPASLGLQLPPNKIHDFSNGTFFRSLGQLPF